MFYQIYPTSFFDSDGDGVGDLRGIVEKLPYVKELGANAIWLNPFYPSPFMDGGYDVSDYYSVCERFGSMKDFEDLIETCKKLQIRVVIDLVIGHTSDRHAWFLQSAKDERNEYSDWYIWTDSNFNKYRDRSIHGLYPRDGGYVINYYACQPALNYGFNRLPEKGKRESAYDLGEDWKMHYTDERLKPLREEILNIMRFWLNRGVDGFRVDLANSLVKECVYNSDCDEDIEGLKWLWNILIGTIKAEYPQAAFIAEWVYPANSVGKCGFDVDYLAHDCSEYNDLFRNEKGTNILPAFERGDNYFSPNGKGSVVDFLKYTEKLYGLLEGKGFFSVPSGYHDVIRLAHGKDEQTLKIAFAFLLTYKHVPFIYYGDELGMDHTFGINKDGGYIRTGCRTPMQWTNGKNRGFSVAAAEKLYLPVNDAKEQSAESQSSRADSLSNTIKRLLAIRRENRAFDADSPLKVVAAEENGLLVYERSDGKKTFTIAIMPNAKGGKAKVNGKLIYGSNGEVKNGELIFAANGFAVIENV